jgi:AcrR family transcriptional regulator
MRRRIRLGSEKRSVRAPQQKRSIEKKEKIVEAAYRIFMEKGYFGTNTIDIAKEAGLSTGSVYSYFVDKKDILLVCLNRFGNNLTEEICVEIEGLSKGEDIVTIVKNILHILAISHECQTRLYHDEVMSLKYRDDDVQNYFATIQKTMMAAIVDKIDAYGYLFPHVGEQTFLLFQMVDGIEDELVFGHGLHIDHDVLIDECAKIIVSMLAKKAE